MNIELKITLWALACTYAIVNSLIYSWVFWSTFDINILQFVSFSDAIPSILYTVFIPCTIMILSIILINHLDNRPPSQKKEQNEKDTAIKSKQKKVKSIIIFILNLIPMLAAASQLIVVFQALKELFLNNKETFLLMIKLLIGLSVAYLVINFLNYKTNFLVNLGNRRRATIIIICLIPFICGSWATKNAYDIIHGSDTMLVDADTKCNSTNDTQYRYISSLSDKAFALSLKDGSICIFKYNYLQLTPEKKHYNKFSDIEINRI